MAEFLISEMFCDALLKMAHPLGYIKGIDFIKLMMSHHQFVKI